MCLVPYLIGHHHDIIHFLVPILFLVVPYPPITALWPPIYISVDEDLTISSKYDNDLQSSMVREYLKITLCLVPYLSSHHYGIIPFLVPILFLIVPYPPITALWPLIYMNFGEDLTISSKYDNDIQISIRSNGFLKIFISLLTSMSPQVTALIDTFNC